MKTGEHPVNMRNIIATAILLVVITFISRARSQSCPAGQSFGNMCMQNCNSTNCNMTCADITGTCMQQCDSGGSCPAADCSNSGACLQQCAKECDLLTCKGENCTQSCKGNCKELTCDSKRCNQICHKGKCTMECSNKAESCNQQCGQGGCVIRCNAKECESSCQGGGCKYEGPPRNKTNCAPWSSADTCMQSGCPWKDCIMSCSKTLPQQNCLQVCEPPITMCPKRMTCDTSNCTQTCKGDCESATCDASTQCIQQCAGKCKSARCTSKTCVQYCLDGACAFECSDETELCSQLCNSTSCVSLVSKAKSVDMQVCQGNCDSMECNSPNCSQLCAGKCPKMTCNGDVCKQECNGTSCEMHCPKSVKTCTQTCKKGSCKFSCQAQNCTRDVKPTSKQTSKPTSKQTSKPTSKQTSKGTRLYQTMVTNGVLFVALAMFLK